MSNLGGLVEEFLRADFAVVDGLVGLALILERWDVCIFIWDWISRSEHSNRNRHSLASEGSDFLSLLSVSSLDWLSNGGCHRVSFIARAVNILERSCSGLCSVKLLRHDWHVDSAARSLWSR